MKEIGKIYVDRNKGYEEWCGEFGGMGDATGWQEEHNCFWNWSMSIKDGKPCLINRMHTENYYGHASREATEEETVKIREIYNKALEKEKFRLHGCYVVFHEGVPDPCIVKIFRDKDKAISYMKELIESWDGYSILNETESSFTIEDATGYISALTLIKQIIEE